MLFIKKHLLSIPLVLFATAALANSSWMMTGFGGTGGGSTPLVPPTVTPLVSSYFNQNQNFGFTNNGLKLPTGSATVPTPATLSHSFYWEMGVDNVMGTFSTEAPLQFMVLNGNKTPGQPSFLFQRVVSGAQNKMWWKNPGPTSLTGGSATAGSNYATGLFPFTVPTSVETCTGRQPTGVWFGGSTQFQQVDPGFGCPVVSPASLNAAAIITSIPGSAAQQSSITATCAAGTTGNLDITASLPVNPGLSPGMSYAVNFATTGGTPANLLTAANLVTKSVSGSGPYSLVGTIAGTVCPGTITAGTVFGGTSGSVTFPAVSLTAPFGTGNGNGGPTGITTRNNQKICALMSEFGSDSQTPGFQSIAMVDHLGVPLPGSPALVTTPNQSTSSVNGYITTATNVLNVTSLKSFTITGATYSAPLVTFSVSSDPGLVPGSEFVVSGIVNSPASPNLYNNKYYIAVFGTNSSTVIGNPISGPLGTPSPFGSSPGTYSSGGVLKSIPIPGQTVLGSVGNVAAPATMYILPYGSNGTTGTGADAAASYALSATSTATIGTSGSPITIFSYDGFYYSGATSANPAGGVATVNAPATIADIFGSIGGSSTLVAGSIKSGWGGDIGNYASLYGIPNSADLPSLCLKSTGFDIQAYATTHSQTLNALYRLNDPGIWGDSSYATVFGHITNTGSNATLVVDSVPLGSVVLLAGSATAKVTGIGLPMAAPVNITLTTSSPGSYALSDTSIAAEGSSGSPIAFAVGKYVPLIPVQSTTVKGYIDTVAGVTKLHATSFDDGGSHIGYSSFNYSLGTGFTASIVPGTGSNGAAVGKGLLTVTLPNSNASTSVVGPGVTVSALPGATALTAGTQVEFQVTSSVGSGFQGYAGTYQVNNSQTASSQVMFGQGTIPGSPNTIVINTLNFGTPAVGMLVGGASLVGDPLAISVSCGTNCWTVGTNYYGTITSDSTGFGTLSTLEPGTYLQNSTASPAITAPVKIVSPLAGADGFSMPGDYLLSGPPNATGNVGSAGSPVVFFGTSVTDGGAVAPGIALTANDLGQGTMFPVDPSTGTGTLNLSGTYDSSLMGGTPSGIQVRVSNSPAGAPLSGCTPCNWSTLSATIGSGIWSGTIAGIPQGSYYVAVRASNGTGYATYQNKIKIGYSYFLWSNGQGGGASTAQGGYYTGFTSGTWGLTKPSTGFTGTGESFLLGPPITSNFVPGQAFNSSGDRYGVVTAGIAIPEGPLVFDRTLESKTGAPTALSYPARDGVGLGIYSLGNSSQSQTMGSGNGTKNVWCSDAKFCSNVDLGIPLTFNAASLTGSWFLGSVTGSTLTVTTRQGGAVSPGLFLSGATGIVGTPKVIRCLTGCSNTLSVDGSTWLLSDALSTVSAGSAMRLDPTGGAPWPDFNIQQAGTTAYSMGGFGSFYIKANTFSVVDTDPSTGIETVVCTDTQPFAYNSYSGNCTGSGVTGWVNYQTGDYQISFTTPPANTHALNAKWTNLVTAQAFGSSLSRIVGLDIFGDGGFQSGTVSAMLRKYPGGISGNIVSSEGTDTGYLFNTNGYTGQVGYQFGAAGYTEMVSWLFNSKFPALVSGTNPQSEYLSGGIWRVSGISLLLAGGKFQSDGLYDQWQMDSATKSEFLGHLTSGSPSTLTLDGPATGPMWEGEIINCKTISANCPDGPMSGIYITDIASGAWGASGSVYHLLGTVANTTASQTLYNPAFYKGTGKAIYVGPGYDTEAQELTGFAGATGGGTHPAAGPMGAGRTSRRWAANIYEAHGGFGSDPQLSRANDSVSGTPSPAFDYGNTYAAIKSGTVSTVGGVSVVDFASGILANARPFVVGQWVTCSGCTARVITAVSLPPTQDVRAGQGQVGQSLRITLSGLLGVSGTNTVTAGCHSVAGTGGSNCINIDISVSNSATFSGTAKGLGNCGANNMNGNAPEFAVPSGHCSDNGLGELHRGYHIGTVRNTYQTTNVLGDVWDDGLDVDGSFNSNSAFTCTYVKNGNPSVVQCVKAPLMASGVFSSVGLWSSGATYVSYGSPEMITGRRNGLLGYVGGQGFPFSGGGTGYSNQTVSGVCSVTTSGFLLPRFDIWTSGGAVVEVVPAASISGGAPIGMGIGSTCTVTPTGGTGFNTGGSITVPYSPTSGIGGIATTKTDHNMMGMFTYDNSGEPSNPLNTFFTDNMGGYFETGIALRPFGSFQGAGVSN